MHLAGDNVRLVPWTADAAASLWYIEPVDSFTITIGNNAYTTINLPFEAILPEGLEAYYAGPAARIEEIDYLPIYRYEPTVIPPRTPLIVIGEKGTYSLALTEADYATDYTCDNKLSGTLKAQSISGKNIYLPNAASAFTKRSTSSGTISANTAYYVGDSSARSLAFNKNIPLGMIPVKIEESTRFYDLQGRLVEKVTPGIYITSEGQKVWIK